MTPVGRSCDHGFWRVVTLMVIRTLCVFLACEGSTLVLIPLDGDPWRTPDEGHWMTLT